MSAQGLMTLHSIIYMCLNYGPIIVPVAASDYSTVNATCHVSDSTALCPVAIRLSSMIATYI